MTEFTPRAEDQVGLDNSAPVQTNRKWIIDLIRDEFDPALARLNPNA